MCPFYRGEINIFPLQRIARDAKLTKLERYKYLDLLLKHKASPNICSSKFQTPINYAIANNDYKSVELLINYGAPLHSEKRCSEKNRPTTPMEYAIIAGAKDKIGHDIIRLLIQRGANVFDIENKYTKYYTAAGFASAYGRYEKAKVIDAYASQLTGSYPNYFKDRKEQDEKRYAFIERRAQVDAEREKARKKREEYRRRNPEPVIDDSNSWVSTAKSAISASARTYEQAKIEQKTPTYTASSTKKYSISAKASSTSSQKTKSLNCNASSNCRAGSEGTTSQYVQKFSAPGLGNTNDAACKTNKKPLSYYGTHCLALSVGKNMKDRTTGRQKRPTTPVGVWFSACSCSSYGNCKREVTVYCGFSKETTGKGQVE